MRTVDMFIDNLLTSSKNVIFSKPNCVECTKVKELLGSTEETYKIINIQEDEHLCEELGIDMMDVIERLKEMTNARMYPICFRDKCFVENNQFKKLIQLSFKIEDTEDF